MMVASATGRAASLLEHATSAEFSFVQRQLLSPRRNQNDFGMVDLTVDLTDKIVSAFADHTGSGALVIPGDLEPRKTTWPGASNWIRRDPRPTRAHNSVVAWRTARADCRKRKRRVNA